MSRIRVAIVDDHAIVREGLRRLVEVQDDMVIAGEAWDGHSACHVAEKRQPDVMLLDIMMPQLGGLEAIDKIRRRSPHTRILIVSSCPAQHFAPKAITFGVNGFVGKDSEPEEVLDAIRAVHDGHLYMSPEVARLLADHALGAAGERAKAPAPHDALSTREFHLLLRFARGQSSADIARDLNISPRTASTYHGTLLQKLGVDSRSDLALYALRNGLID
jgi:two-component system invasion response regulator UvrY